MPLLSWSADRPALRRPVLVVAFDGFVDAGAAASTAALFLRHRWQSEVIGTFDGDALIDYRARRPTVVVDRGELRRVDWPVLELCAATVEGAHDVLLLLGPEPDMRWHVFCSEVAQLCVDLGVETVVGLGAYPAASPHTRPVRVTRAANPLGLHLAPSASPVPGYTGPIGIASAMHPVLHSVGIPAVGLWAEVPHYIAASPNPAAALSLVQVAAEVVGTEVDTTELQAAANVHQQQIDDAIAEHPEAAGMVTALEQHVDSGDDLELATGEDIAAEIERFLRMEGN